MTNDIERQVRDSLEADPTIQRLLRMMMPREPRWAYWRSDDGAMYIYTTEKMGDGKYASAIMKPVGKGSRSGKAEQWKTTREVHHATRRAAKARAYRLYQQAMTS